MTITPEQLAVLMQEVEVADPIDFADLPFNEQELRGLIANHLCEMADAMESFSPEDRNLALLAVAAIAFGLWRDAREKQAENEYIELPQAAELPSAASQPEQLE